MSGLSWILIIGAGIFWLQTNEQRRRMGLLAKHLAPTRVEKILGTLIDGYLKALEFQDPERQQHAGMPWGGKSKNWWSISSVLPMVLPQKAPKPPG